ncbi:MAG TPA: dTDP-4-dehydrorhamnose 3,5-epimerase family protein [Roseococcus sp.]|jgi:dTDP-4-dehydrorhamnose 3,5-epimerase|nr:dTDP-4-dehydrorhamnose 3,5-epimerase family protein [Roseococcus sp.]
MLYLGAIKVSIFDDTMAAAVQDGATVTPEGTPLRRLTHGVTLRRLPTHADARGTVTELFDPRWGTHPDPLVFAYTFSIRPGVVKGWNLHRRHQDRYAIIAGEMLLVLYDPRPESPTYGEVCTIVLSEYDRCLVNVPENVWHADYNIGTRDVLVVNFPTIPYDHADPDKWRLPITSPLIPYRFPAGVQGW